VKTLRLIPALVLLGTLHSTASIVITEVMSSSGHPSASGSNDDWFEITNTGTTAVSTTFWSWDDNTNTPGTSSLAGLISIAAGESVIVTGEAIGAEAAWQASWNTDVRVLNLGGTSFQGLGSGGDSVTIYDGANANAILASVTFGNATQGFSFEWDTNGNPLGLSVIGENGAYRAATDGSTVTLGPGIDVGSPGIVVVPEASTSALLLGFAGFAAFIRRRK
jgi:hypothetical protein